MFFLMRSTRSISRNPGAGQSQSAKVLTGLSQPALGLWRRLRLLATSARIGFASGSSVAALAANSRSLTTGPRSRWP